MRNAFFKAARMEPGGYGLKGEEIIIAGADAGWGPGELASAFANDKTSVVCIQDPDLAAVNAIAAELEPFSDIKPARITPMRAFGDIREFDATFEAHLGERLAEAADMKLFAAPKKFPLLKTDIKYSLRRLGKIFKLHEGFTITVTGAREEKLELHEDYGHRHEKRGVRSLSPYGTIVAPRAIFRRRCPAALEITN